MFNFAYSETSVPSYYFLWKWIFALVMDVSSTAILIALFFFVASNDNSAPTPKAIAYVDTNHEVAD